MFQLTNAEIVKKRMSFDSNFDVKMDNFLRTIQEKIIDQANKGYFSITLGSDPKYDIEFNLFTGQYGSSKERFKTELGTYLTRNGYNVELKFDNNSNKYWVISW